MSTSFLLTCCFQEACYCLLSYLSHIDTHRHTPSSKVTEALTLPVEKQSRGLIRVKESLDENNQAGASSPCSPSADEGDTFGVGGLPICLKRCSDFSLLLSHSEVNSAGGYTLGKKRRKRKTLK